MRLNILNFQTIKLTSIIPQAICILALGIAILGLVYRGRAFFWILKAFGTVKKSDSEAQKALNAFIKAKKESFKQESIATKVEGATEQKYDCPPIALTDTRTIDGQAVKGHEESKGLPNNEIEEKSFDPKVADVPKQTHDRSPIFLANTTMMIDGQVSVPEETNALSNEEMKEDSLGSTIADVPQQNHEDPIISLLDTMIKIEEHAVRVHDESKTLSNQEIEEESKDSNVEDDPKQNRRYPPISRLDTIMIIDGKVVSVHGEAKVFSNEEIIEVHKVTRRVKISEAIPDKLLSQPAIYIDYSTRNKAIIQQQAVRGCTAAAAAMLIVDNGKPCNPRTLIERNLGNTSRIVLDIERAGLKPIVSKSPNNLGALEQALQKRGSAIISIDFDDEDPFPNSGGHVVVVDEMTDEIVRLRDPYHGWEISVTRQAFIKRYAPHDIIQIVKE